MTDQSIINSLRLLLKKSHAPYSNFHVASIAIDENGEKYEGVNVESAAFSTTICAERNAIFGAISREMKWGELKEIHLTAIGSKVDKKQFIYPCGSCRQVIYEASKGGCKVYCYNALGEVSENKISDLLSFGFSGDEV